MKQFVNHYIIFKIEDITEDFGCANNVRVMQVLIMLTIFQLLDFLDLYELLPKINKKLIQEDIYIRGIDEMDIGLILTTLEQILNYFEFITGIILVLNGLYELINTVNEDRFEGFKVKAMMVGYLVEKVEYPIYQLSLLTL